MTAGVPDVVSVTSSVGGAGVSTLTIDMPSSPAVGRVLLLILGFHGAIPVSGLSAWILHDMTLNPFGLMRTAAYSRICTGTEPSSYIVDGFDVNDPRLAMVLELDECSDHDVSTSQYKSGLPYVNLELPTSSDNDLVLSVLYSQALNTPTNTLTWSGGTAIPTVITSSIAGWNGYLSVSREIQSTMGLTTPRTVTRNGTNWSDNAALATVTVKARDIDTRRATRFMLHSAGLGRIVPVNRPANPALILYGSTLDSYAAQWARRGALVIAGRDNYDTRTTHIMADGGATVLIYLDAIIDATYGRYHDKLINSSEFGPAVPNWPGSPTANAYGHLNDFRMGSILQAKLPGVINLIITENPHISGIFLDDCGSRSYFPGFNWTTWSGTDQEAYRDGAIGIVQTARSIADVNNMFIMVNGAWGATSTAGVGDGGYPDKTKHGCSLADGGFVENHNPALEMAFWAAYSDPATTQWGKATARGVGYMHFHNSTSADPEGDRDAWVAADVAAFAGAGDYSGNSIAPWGSFTNFGIPHR